MLSSFLIHVQPVVVFMFQLTNMSHGFIIIPGREGAEERESGESVSSSQLDWMIQSDEDPNRMRESESETEVIIIPSIENVPELMALRKEAEQRRRSNFREAEEEDSDENLPSDSAAVEKLTPKIKIRPHYWDLLDHPPDEPQNVIEEQPVSDAAAGDDVFPDDVIIQVSDGDYMF